jgi:hypothetical protein
MIKQIASYSPPSIDADMNMTHNHIRQQPWTFKRRFNSPADGEAPGQALGGRRIAVAAGVFLIALVLRIAGTRPST